MSKQHDDRPKSPPDFVIGQEAFAKIRAVDGLELSADAKERIRQADRDNLSHEQRREQIIRAHRRT